MVSIRLLALVHHWRRLWVAMGLRGTNSLAKPKASRFMLRRVLCLGNDPRNRRHRIFYVYVPCSWHRFTAWSQRRGIDSLHVHAVWWVMQCSASAKNGSVIFQVALILVGVWGFFSPFALCFTVLACVPLFPVLVDFFSVLATQWRPLFSAMFGALVSLFLFAVMGYVGESVAKAADAHHIRCWSDVGSFVAFQNEYTFPDMDVECSSLLKCVLTHWACT